MLYDILTTIKTVFHKTLYCIYLRCALRPLLSNHIRLYTRIIEILAFTSLFRRISPSFHSTLDCGLTEAHHLKWNDGIDHPQYVFWKEYVSAVEFAEFPEQPPPPAASFQMLIICQKWGDSLLFRGTSSCGAFYWWDYGIFRSFPNVAQI